MDYSDFIKRRRLMMKYSQKRLGELVGVSRGTVRSWEIGAVLPTPFFTIAKLEVALGLKEGELYSLLTHKIHKAGLLSLMCNGEEKQRLGTQRKGRL